MSAALLGRAPPKGLSRWGSTLLVVFGPLLYLTLWSAPCGFGLRRIVRRLLCAHQHKVSDVSTGAVREENARSDCCIKAVHWRAQISRQPLAVQQNGWLDRQTEESADNSISSGNLKERMTCVST
jgi:hypothetical protein